MAVVSELVGRAVEAAAQADYESHARARIVKWDELDEHWRDQSRAKVRPAVLVALGVVADHCTTEIAKTSTREFGRIGAFFELAAELRETPE